MAAVRAILRSGVRDLTVVSYGGPDVGLLCAAQRVKKVVYGFVTLDSIALDPHFRAARQGGAIEAMEIDEGMFYLGLLAASQRVPFLPTRAGLGSDVLRVNPELRTVVSPYATDGVFEELVAMPALHLDAAFVHVNAADTHGNGQVLGPDPFFDDLFLGAAALRVVTTEKVVQPGDLTPAQTMAFSRLSTDAVVEAPGGAHFTSCPPDYDRDEALQSAYAKSAADAETWNAFALRYVDVDEAGYQAAVSEGVSR
jgi:glutaconate CoA-transferase, subunit A